MKMKKRQKQVVQEETDEGVQENVKEGTNLPLV